MERNNLFEHRIENYFITEKWDVTPLATGNNSTQLSLQKAKENGKLFFRSKMEYHSKEKFEECFANQLYDVESSSYMLVVEKKEDKLAIKMFHNYKKRRAGVFYFTRKKYMFFLTINLKSGELYIGHLLNYHRKKHVQRRIKKNTFTHSSITDFIYILANAPFGSELNRESVMEELKRAFFFELEKYHGEPFTREKLHEVLFEFYLKKKNIKYPNNFYIYQKQWGVIPKIKELRKFDLKFVDAFMYKNSMKGDSIRKVLHECKDYVQPKNYTSMVEVFGKDWIHQTPNLSNYLIDRDDEVYHNFARRISTHFIMLTKVEQRRCWDFFLNYHIQSEEGVTDYLPIRVLSDHVSFISYLREEGAETGWKSKNWQEFTEEHNTLSLLVSQYRKGIYLRTYPEGYYEVFTKPIFLDNQFHVTKILDSTENYNEESSFQSNCVRTYIGKAASFIVSVRRGMERATIEYKIKKLKNDEFEISREQSLGRFNKVLDSSWDSVLAKLDERVTFVISEWGYDIQLTKHNKMNKNVSCGIEYTDLGYPKWDNSKIFDSNSTFFFDEF
jgi:hypothetical protein